MSRRHEQVSKITSKYEDKRAREELDKRTNETADRYMCWDVDPFNSLAYILLRGTPRSALTQPAPSSARVGVPLHAIGECHP